MTSTTKKMEKAISSVAKLKFNESTSKWEVIVKLASGDKVFIRSKDSKLAIRYFNGKHKAKMEDMGVDILEVINEDGSVKTITLGAKTPRKRTATKDIGDKPRKVAVRKPFPAFPVTIYGMQHLAGSVKEGIVVSRTSGNYNVEVEGVHGKLVQSFNANTGILKGHNPFHGWQINTAEVIKLHTAAKKKTA